MTFLFDIASLIIICEDIDLPSVKALDEMKIIAAGRWMENQTKINVNEFYRDESDTRKKS